MNWLVIKPDASDRLPVSQLSEPSRRMTLSVLLVKLVSLLEYVTIQARMALGRSDISNFAVTMLVVVPANETMHPQARRLQTFETVGR